jgi:hypothetical protein
MSIIVPPSNNPWAFVRLTAWSMIIVGAVSVCMSLGTAFLALTVFRADVIDALRETPELAGMPEWLWLGISNLLILSVILIWASVLTALAGWGLLRRQAWALWFSIAMFWLGALSNLFGIWLHFVFLSNFRTSAPGMPEWIAQMMQANYWSAQISGAVFGLVFAAGFGWTAWKLGTAPVRAEFTRS